MERMLDELSRQADEAAKLEAASQPHGIITSLQEYQRQGLAWMLWRERQDVTGGILADDMGVGKTLTCLSLVVSDKQTALSPTTELHLASRTSRHSNATLVVCPKNALPVWKANVDQHVKPNLLCLYEYSGRNKKIRAADFAEYDVVTASYHEVVSQVRNSGHLTRIPWKRILLDEAQRQFRVPPGLHVTGSTPPLVRHGFLRIPMMNHVRRFLKLGRIPVDYHIQVELSKALMSAYLLQRKKQDVCPLPTKTVTKLEVDLQGREAAVYEALFRPLRETFYEYMATKEGSRLFMWQHIRSIVLRLRQTCVHPSLLSRANDVEDLLSDVRALHPDVFQKSYESAKFKALNEQLAIALSDGHKCVIASQWTSALDIAELHIRRQNIACTSITGRVKCADERQKRANAFNQERTGPQVMLLSVKVGGTAVTLTGGTRFFLLDVHWNPFAELQAFDRIHRIGQLKQTHIVRIIAKNTVENGVLAIQQRKLETANNIFEIIHRNLTFDVPR